MLRVLIEHLELISLHDVAATEPPEWLEDAADWPILAGAMAGNADILLTNDGALLKRSGGSWGSLRLAAADGFFAELDRAVDEELEPDEVAQPTASKRRRRASVPK